MRGQAIIILEAVKGVQKNSNKVTKAQSSISQPTI